MSSLKSNSAHQDHCQRQERLVCEFAITSNATPASKKHHADIPSVVVLRSQGKTAVADAVESLTWTTAVDNDTGNSVFGIILDLGSNKADKVYSVTLTEVSAVSASEAVSGPLAAAASYLTAAGNIAIEVAATGLNLASESPTFRLEVEYREAL